MRITKAASILIIPIIIILMFSSCKGNDYNMVKQDVSGTQDYNTQIIINDTSINTDIKVDKVLYALNKIVNDDIWYKGKSSRLFGLEGMDLSIEIYGLSPDNETIYVCFKDEFKANEDKGYFAVALNRYGDGYANYIQTFFFEDTYELVVGKVKELKYTLALSTTFKFQNAIRPDYMPQSLEKEQIVSSMLDQAEKYIREDLKNMKDKYKIQIIDFRQMDYKTRAIIENSNGDIWILEIFGTDGKKVNYGEHYSVKEFPVLIDSVANYRKEIARETNILVIT
ncbi:MAG TPA: hypothetical protein VFD03_04750 [Clostridia bacterium]|nr:hypothetical protein [Clostridia bacterium]